MACAKLSLGDDLSNKNLDQLQVALSNILELQPEDYAKTKVRTKLTWLDTAVELLSPMGNPASYKSCQDSALVRGIVPVLLGLVVQATSDGVRSKAAEVLARLSFDNRRAAETIALHQAFVPAVEVMLQGPFPEQLGALQLSQAIAASSCPQVASVMPALLATVRPKLSDMTFTTLPLATLEVLISASFHDSIAVASSAPLSWFASVVDEGGSRPSWLPLEPVQVLTCGMLAANLLEIDLSADLESRELMAKHLSSGAFFDYVLLALEAAANRTAWPVDTGVYHSPNRLAKLMKKLSAQGQNHRLLQAIPHVVHLVESRIDDEVTRLALEALFSLSTDVQCLEELLASSTFRKHLEELRSEGQGQESTDLASRLDACEAILAVADETHQAAADMVANAPNVHALALLFSDYAQLDQDLPPEHVEALVKRVPLGPMAAIQASRSGGTKQAMSFDALAQRLYGSPTVLGWWPSLLQDTAAFWATRSEGSRLPDLVELVATFEAGTGGKSTISSQVILDELLPRLGLATEGTAVEVAFSELRGDVKLNLEVFAQWLLQLEQALIQEEAEAAAAAEAEAAAVTSA